EVPFEKFEKCGTIIPGSRSKEGHLVIYLKPGAMFPHEISLEELNKFCTWFYGYAILCEKMDALRKGIIYIDDFAGYGWKNFDYKFQKGATEILQDTFPIPFKKIIVLNAPLAFKTLVLIVRVFTKKKIMDRLALMETKDLTDLIDEDMLADEYGGKFPVTNEH